MWISLALYLIALSGVRPLPLYLSLQPKIGVKVKPPRGQSAIELETSTFTRPFTYLFRFSSYRKLPTTSTVAQNNALCNDIYRLYRRTTDKPAKVPTRRSISHTLCTGTGNRVLEARNRVGWWHGGSAQQSVGGMEGQSR